MSEHKTNIDEMKILALELFRNYRLADSLELCKVICEQDTADVRIWLLQAAIHARSDSLDEIIRCCQRVITLQPGNIEARYNLGIALQRKRQYQNAISQYNKILEIHQDHPSTLANLGTIYFELGDTGKAELFLKRALHAAPDFIPAMNCLGMVLLAQSRPEDAARHYEKFLKSTPENPETYFNLGTCYVALHLPDQAETAFRNAIRYAPSHAAAYNSLGNILRNAGRIDEAVECFMRAVKLSPEDARLQHNLSISLYKSGNVDDAARHAVQAAELDPENPTIKHNLLWTISHTETPGKLLSRAHLLGLFSDSGTDLQMLERPALSVLRAESCLNRVMEDLAGLDIQKPEEIMLDNNYRTILKDSLLHSILQNTCINLMDIEKFMSRLRHAFLVYSIDYINNIGPDVTAYYTDFVASLACQCFNNEYCYPTSDSEFHGANQVAATLHADSVSHKITPESLEFLISVLGCYIPLHKFGDLVKALLPDENMVRPAVSLLLRRQIHEPETEEQIKQSIPLVTIISDKTSMAVRQQYEESPYPRWLSFPTQQPRDYGDYFQEILPGFVPPDYGTGDLHVLIAGCGSGRHALITANRFARSSILAVDLSRSSLAYASRMAEEHKVFNAEFAQGDILGLGNIEDRFHIIESVGVLHHMNEPEAGLEVLQGLLVPDGLMNIGLYSKIGRRHITQARKFFHDKGFKPDPEGIRAARQLISKLATGHPLRNLMKMHDFYSLSECRDLNFHTQETCYDLLEIKDMLERAGLRFIGFESVSPAHQSKFRSRFPDDSSMTDLGLWHQFEQENQDAFTEMYVFWCQKNQSRSSF